MATETCLPSFQSPINYTTPAALTSFPDVTIITTLNDPDNPEFTATMFTNRAVLSSASPVLKPILLEIDLLEDITIITDLEASEMEAVLRFCNHGELSFHHDPRVFQLFGINVKELSLKQIKIDNESWEVTGFGAADDMKLEDFDPLKDEVYDTYVGEVEAEVMVDEALDYDEEEDKMASKASGRKQSSKKSKESDDEDFKPPAWVKAKEEGPKRRRGRPRKDANQAETEPKSKKPRKTPRKRKSPKEKSICDNVFDVKLEQDSSSEDSDMDFHYGNTGEDNASPKNFRGENERVRILMETDKQGNVKYVMRVRKRNPVTNEWGPVVRLDLTEAESASFKARADERRRLVPQKKERKFFSAKERDPMKKYQCGKCNFGANIEWDFRLHTLRHEQPEIHFCFLCEAGFFNKVEMKSHMKNLHQGEVSCKLCGQVFTRNGNLLIHLRAHEDGTWKRETYQECVQCGSQLKQSSKLSDHCNREGPFHTNKCVQCPAPSIEFQTHQEHKEHIDIMHGGRFMYVCGLCDEIFENNVFKQRHRKEVHKVGLSKKTACPVCGDLFANVNIHMLSKHKIGDGVECDECNQMFPTSYALEYHKKRKHGQFLCDLCPYNTRISDKLKLHVLNMHTKDEDKPFHCKICGKGLSTIQRLRQHELIHTNLRPFKCEMCPKDFNDKSNLTQHLKTVHFGLKRTDKLPKLP